MKTLSALAASASHVPTFYVARRVVSAAVSAKVHLSSVKTLKVPAVKQTAPAAGLVKTKSVIFKTFN
jgi:hypothetical protein